jgi:hypothetical protein
VIDRIRLPHSAMEGWRSGVEAAAAQDRTTTKKGFEPIVRAAGVATAKLRGEHSPNRGAVTSMIVRRDALKLGALELLKPADRWLPRRLSP